MTKIRNKPHIRKICGIWEVVHSGRFGDLYGKAQRWVQRMNCREMLKNKSLEMFRNDQKP